MPLRKHGARRTISSQERTLRRGFSPSCETSFIQSAVAPGVTCIGMTTTLSGLKSAPDQQIWASELSVVAQMLRGLPDGQREALILIGAGGFSYEEAAEICSVPIGTMKSRAARGRAALQSALDGTAPLTRAALTSTATEDILEQLNAITAERASVN